MKKITFLISIIFIFPLLSFAQTSDWNYFGFSPLASQAIKVSAFSSVSQKFKPYNDFINGVDIWADNSGSSGSAYFKLLNSNGEVLVSKTITIPQIPLKWGGEKLHVSFTPIHVISNNDYTIKIYSSLPKFEIYYTDKTSLLEHNASFNSSAIVRSAYLESTEQDFAFKFALYENGDNLTPETSNIFFDVVSDNQMKISLNANEPVDMSIDYQSAYNSDQLNDRRSISFSNAYNFCIEGVSVCGLLLNTLPNLTYNYQLNIKDYWGNQSLVSGSFESSKAGVFTASDNSSTSTGEVSSELEIINPRAISVTANSATIAWSTNIPFNSRVVVSLDSLNSEIATRLGDNTFELEHTINTGNVLKPNTVYFATIITELVSAEIIGEVFNFTTLSQTQNNNQTQPPPLPPDTNTNLNENDNQFTDISVSLPILTIGIINNDDIETNPEVNISWQKPASGNPTNGYRIDIFDKNNNLIKQLTVLADSDNISIRDLPPGEYRAIVYSNNNGVFEKVGKETNFSLISKLTFWEKFNFRTTQNILIILGILIFGTVIIFKIVGRKKIKDESLN